MDPYSKFWESMTIEEAYAQAGTFMELCHINVKFLKGIYDHTAYHCGPVDEETVPLLENLCLLNSLGCYTFNGQPPDSAIQQNSDHSIIWRCLQSRGYLDFFIPKRFSEDLRTFLAPHENVFYAIDDGESIYSTFSIPERERFPLHREALIIASGFEVSSDTFKTANWKNTLCSSIPSDFFDPESEIELHENAGLDRRILDDCAICVLATRDFDSKVSLELLMIEFMYSTFKGV